MLSLSPATRVFLALTPIDGRKSFNGLYTLVKETLQQEPTSGFLFVFVNRPRNQTTFNIPIRHRNHRVSVASTPRTEIAGSPAKGTERDRGH
jgi:hypothetical protein